MCGSDIFLGIVAIFFPPIAVWVKRGICSADSLINIALCCLAYLPGLLHAWYIIAISPEPTYRELSQDAERGHVTHYYVQTQPARRREGAHGGYGTVNSAVDQQFPGQQQGVVQPKPKAVAAPTQQQAGPSEEVPPSYAQAVGDHKVQGP